MKIYNRAEQIYRALLLFCAFYFLAVAAAHQAGTKIPLLYIFYSVPSERYQDLIISFLSFGWCMLFLVGFLDRDLKPGIQAPILLSGTVALFGLVRAGREMAAHAEIHYEIAALAVLLIAMIWAFMISVRRRKANGP